MGEQLRFRPKTAPYKSAPALAILLAGLLLLAWRQPAITETQVSNPTANWTTPLRISIPVANGGAFNPSLQAAPDGTLLAMYSSGPSGEQLLTYSFSNDTGNSWSTPAVVPNSQDDSTQAHFRFDSQNKAHVVWTEGDAESIDTLVYVQRSPTNQWSDIKLINSAPTAEILILQPKIFASSGGRLDVVWSQGAVQTEIYHSYSLNEGATWSTPNRIHIALVNSSNPDLAVTADGYVHVVWEEGEVNELVINFATYYARGTIAPNGAISGWDAPITISAAPGVTEALRPILASDGGDLRASFTRRDFDPSEGVEQFTYYTQASAGFAPVNLHPGVPMRVNTTDPYALVSGLALCGNRVHVYYHGIDNPAGQIERIWGASSPNGIQWTMPTAITTGATRAVNPQIVCHNNLLHIVYQRIQPAGEGSQIYYIREISKLYLPTIFR